MIGPFRSIAARYELRNVARFDPATITASTLAAGALGVGGGLAASKLMQSPNIPAAPTPTPPVRMPDPNSPDNLAARRSAMFGAMSAGRASTNLTTPLAAGGLYGGAKTGG